MVVLVVLGRGLREDGGEREEGEEEEAGHDACLARCDVWVWEKVCGCRYACMERKGMKLVVARAEGGREETRPACPGGNWRSGTAFGLRLCL